MRKKPGRAWEAEPACSDDWSKASYLNLWFLQFYKRQLTKEIPFWEGPAGRAERAGQPQYWKAGLIFIHDVREARGSQ